MCVMFLIRAILLRNLLVLPREINPHLLMLFKHAAVIVLEKH